MLDPKIDFAIEFDRGGLRGMMWYDVYMYM